MALRLQELKSRLAEFCRTRPIRKLEVFGSVARGTAHDDSDLDLLVTLAPGLAQEQIFQIAGEIEDVAGQPVDFVIKESLLASHNPYKRAAILGSAVTVYER